MSSIKKETIVGPHRLLMGNCTDILPSLSKFDAIVTDPPYGTTRCEWDEVIPFDRMWESLSFVRNPKTPVILTCAHPFASMLICSNLRDYRYDLIWDKVKGTGFLNAKKMPMRNHEMIAVFYSKLPTYNPQKTKGHQKKKTYRSAKHQTAVYGQTKQDYHYDSDERYPRSVLTFSTDTQNSSLHPTQKPVELMRYLIRTYTNPGDRVLDFAMGSATTGVAAILEGRKFTGIELNPDFYEIACKRLRDAYDRQEKEALQEATIDEVGLR